MTFPAHLLSYFNSQQSQINYTTPGTYSFTVPEGVSSLSAVVIGGGGGGAGSDGITVNTRTGGGGGAGLSWAVFGVQPGDVLTVNVATGGTGGTDGTGGASFNGVNGGTSSISIASRVGVVGAIDLPQTIIQGSGGSGGIRNTAGNNTGLNAIGGLGGLTPIANGVSNIETYCPIYRFAGGNGGSGGGGQDGASGGGGAGGYAGNGGNGGSGSNQGTSDPTAAAVNSGGGGGGGGSDFGLGYGGGGVGGIGYTGFNQGTAGINQPTGTQVGGGDGASYFIDPNEGIVATVIDQTFSTTDTINYPSSQTGDILLLLSATDSTSGITQIPIPSEFTLINQSYDNGVYKVTKAGIQTAIVPATIAPANASRDLNFATSYRTVPITGLSGSLTGLTASSIHTMISIRDIPNPISINWATDSGDPGVAGVGQVFATLMPDPPQVSQIPDGAVSIIAGFLANNILNAVGTAGANTTAINEVSGGNSTNGQGIGLCASYIQTVGTGTTDPDAFLTGTAAHARAYSIQINRSSPLTPVTVVGSAVTGTLSDGTAVQTLSLPSGIQEGDLLVYIGANDNPQTPIIPNSLNGRGWTTQTAGVTQTLGTSNGGLMTGNSTDIRGNLGGLGYRISYQTYTNGTGTPQTQISGLSGGDSGTPTCHMLIAFSDATYGNNTTVWDNNTSSTYGPPDPPALTTNSPDSLVLAVGMIDNIKISNVSTVTAPPFYTMLGQPQSYGVQNNGAIIMTANRNNITVQSVDPGAFVGNGGNIWVSQNIVISGPTTQGTKDNPGFYGGGGGSMSDGSVGFGMTGANGSVRIIWGTGRRYPSSNQINQSTFDSILP
jgi:hypothetical protein